MIRHAIALPVCIDLIKSSFRILDAHGRPIAYVYAAEKACFAAMPDMLLFEEAGEGAIEIA